jgi:hypothetical protein
MPWHIVVKAQESAVVDHLPKVFSKYKVFLVCEKYGTPGVHWHLWTDCDWKEAKVRRELDKVREEKLHGVSVRSWDDNLGYFCKGLNEGNWGRDLIVNTVGITLADVEEMRYQWLQNDANTDRDPDYKMPSLLDELVDAVRDQDIDEDGVIAKYVELIHQRKGYKMSSIKSTGQAHIRTALMFTNEGEKYRKKLFLYYKQGLWS